MKNCFTTSIANGSFFTQRDEDAAARVAVLGQTVVDHFQPFATANDLKAYLQELFAPVWEDRWVKSPKKKKPKSTAPKKRIEGGHTSIYRILRAAKQKVPKDV